VRASEGPTHRVYRIGSPRDYLLGAALLIVAAWFTWEFAHADHLRSIDRPILATVSALTFGGWDHRAVVRLDLDAPSGEQRDLRITYPGRIVHRTIASLADEIARRASLMKTRKSEHDALVFREGEIDWIRSGGIHHAP
jgi:hypothetical protein